MINENREKLASFNALLNKPGFNGTAAIATELDVTNEYGNDYVINDLPNGIITSYISDCNKVIQLDFDVSTKDYSDNSLYKIDTLIEVLTKLRADILKISKFRLEYDHDKLNYKTLKSVKEQIKYIEDTYGIKLKIQERGN